MMNGSDGKSRWICPNDRELTLRAKLDSGWCVKSGLNSPSSTNQISELEQQIIMDVLRRSQQIEKMENDRITRLQERLNNIKRNAKGDGNKACALCSDSFGLFGTQHTCKDCSKAVCSKCGVDTFTPGGQPIWLCKICSETREIWKKSGAWFFQKIPKFSVNPLAASRGPGSSSISSSSEIDVRKEPSRSSSSSSKQSSSDYNNHLSSSEAQTSRSCLSSPAPRRRFHSPARSAI